LKSSSGFILKTGMFSAFTFCQEELLRLQRCVVKRNVLRCQVCWGSRVTSCCVLLWQLWKVHFLLLSMPVMVMYTWS